MATVPLRERIVRAAAELLVRQGRDAVSTRAVSAAAGVQAPAIYRQFGDMQGLLEAAAREVLAGYVRQKSKREATLDPVADLRRGWDEHVAFGLANPDAYAILYRAAPHDSADAEGIAVLQGLLRRVAEAGVLRLGVEEAAQLVRAGGSGVVMTLLATPQAQRDLRLSDQMREAVITAITTDAAKPTRTKKRVAPRALALRAVLGEASVLTKSESGLLDEWLDRLAKADD